MSRISVEKFGQDLTSNAQDRIRSIPKSTLHFNAQKGLPLLEPAFLAKSDGAYDRYLPASLIIRNSSQGATGGTVAVAT